MDRFSKFFGELRRRNVFRAGAAYIVLAWLVIQVADILVDTFAAPLWVMQFIVFALAGGLPLTLVLAWVYEITTAGIKRTEEVSLEESITYVIGRKLDFIIIGVLVAALSLSLYANLRPGPATSERPDPVSVLIADFKNSTGDSIFDGTLEVALRIGLEGASFITAYQRAAALQIANEMNPGSTLGEAAARLVSVREGIQLVLVGSVEEVDGHYEFIVRAVEPKEGEVIADVKASAKSKLEVLASVGELAAKLRELLGDDAIDHERMAEKETFTAASLEAVRSYVIAQNFQDLGKDDEAVNHYAKAVELDPIFGRAYSGWALSLFNLGKTDEAEQLWDKALMNMDTMTERERMRTLGLYFSLVTRNYPKAIENYQALIEKYPADDAAHNNLAVLHFFTLDFDAALAAGQKVLDLYPNVVIYRGNYVLYAMYAGDFETAVTGARQLLETEPTYFKAWLPIAVSALANNDIESARSAYESMLSTGEQGAATAVLGLADSDIFAGDFAAARTVIQPGIEQDLADGKQYIVAAKYMAIADAYTAEGDVDAAVEAANKVLSVTSGKPWVIGAALTYLTGSRFNQARSIADDLVNELQPQSRAYGMMIHGLIASQQDRHVDAIETITQAIALSDSWLLRFSLGKVYLRAGYDAEALGEFMICRNRHGEATSLFLDDLPTYRHMVPLYYWLGVAQDGLGMKAAAAESLQTYLSLRPSGGIFVDDAEQRLN